jgi:hypothetical protein
MNERIKQLEKQCWSHYIDGVLVDGHLHFDVNKFAELLINECAACCGSQADRQNIRKRFGLPVESNVKYPGVEPTGHNTQYTRKPNLPEIKENNENRT